MQTFDYKAATSLDEALALLKEHGEDAELIAGGTSLLIMMQQGLVQPKVVIGLAGVKELRGIRRTPDGGLVYGATTTHRELETSPEAFAYDAQLPKALGVIATIRITPIRASPSAATSCTPIRHRIRRRSSSRSTRTVRPR